MFLWSVCNDKCQWVLDAMKFSEINLWNAKSGQTTMLLNSEPQPKQITNAI